MTGNGALRTSVLHVDDDQSFTDLTGRALERVDAGMAVTAVQRGADALARLESKPFDCIVADYEMPGMDGLELLEAVSAAYPDLPFILFTGKGNEDVASEAISAGVTDYIQKEASEEQFAVLANRIQNAVESAHAQVAARQSRDRLAAMTDAFPDVAFLIDDTGRYRDVLSGPEQLTRYGHEQQLIGNQFADLFPEPIADTFLETVQETLGTATTQTLEYELETSRGTRVFEARVAPLRTHLDGNRAVLWVARDITEHRESAAALRRKNERLQEFAGMVSHDLRNPLNVAKSHLQLARESEEAAHHLDFVDDAHDRMEALISDMLTLARESEGVEETDAVSIPVIAAQCWRAVDTAEAGLTVSTESRVICDRRRLTRLLENLFRNAIEHAGTSAAVEVGTLDDGRGFYVADDGPGFPDDTDGLVCERGYSTKDDGTGFGLAIVENIAAAHGWTVELTESDTGGARVELHAADVIIPDEDPEDPDNRERRTETNVRTTTAESRPQGSHAGE